MISHDNQSPVNFIGNARITVAPIAAGFEAPELEFECFDDDKVIPLLNPKTH